MKTTTRIATYASLATLAIVLAASCATGVENDTIIITPKDAGRDVTNDAKDSGQPTDAGHQDVGGTDSNTQPDSGQTTDSGPTCYIPKGSCNVEQQCGCSTNQTCAPDDYGSPTCYLAGNTPDYSWCSKTEDCRVGSGCISNICHPFCDSTCQPGGICQPILSSVTQTVVANACMQTCDPIHPQTPEPGLYPCGPGLGCLPGDSNYTPDCYVPGNRSVGMNCASSADCAAGTLCVKVSNTSTCMLICSNADPCPDPNMQCYVIDPSLSSGPELYGVCN